MDHLRIALWDIPNSAGMQIISPLHGPKAIGRKEKAPVDQVALNSCQKAIFDGMDKMVELAQDKANDLFTPFPYGNGQTLLRTALRLNKGWIKTPALSLYGMPLPKNQKGRNGLA